MARTHWSFAATVVLLASSVLALATMQPGLDYFADSSAIDALVRGDAHGFFGEQPLMGPLSLLVRAPFVAAVFDADLTTVYFAGVIPCYGALLVLALVLVRRMDGRSRGERLLVVLLCAGSPLAIRAVHWGHPEELLGAALCVGAMLAGLGGRAVLAGILLGCAFATKQWALVAAAPILAALPARQWTFVATAALVGVAFTLPMLLGDPDRFWLITRAAGSADPNATLSGLTGLPGGRTTPYSVWLPLTHSELFDGQRYLFLDPLLARLSHPLIVLAGLPLTWAVYRRTRSPLGLHTALRLLALVFLLRGALDPNGLDYYLVPLIATLAALGALGGPRELRVALLTAAGFAVAFAAPADSLRDLVAAPWPRWALYMATVLPLGAWLTAGLFSVPRRQGIVTRNAVAARTAAAGSAQPR